GDGAWWGGPPIIANGWSGEPPRYGAAPGQCGGEPGKCGGPPGICGGVGKCGGPPGTCGGVGKCGGPPGICGGETPNPRHGGRREAPEPAPRSADVKVCGPCVCKLRPRRCNGRPMSGAQMLFTFRSERPAARPTRRSLVRIA